MTRRARKVCSRSGCPNLTDRGKGRCDSCDRTADRARGTAAERGYDREWNQLSRDIRAEEPFCQYLLDGCTGLAEVVDHADGLGPLGPRGRDRDNLIPACRSCHRRKTNRADGGGWAWRQP